MECYKKVLYLSFTLGFLIAALILFVAFDHNPQGEFIDTNTGEINIHNTLQVFISWLLLSSIVIGTTASVITFLIKVFIKRI